MITFFMRRFLNTLTISNSNKSQNQIDLRKIQHMYNLAYIFNMNGKEWK